MPCWLFVLVMLLLAMDWRLRFLSLLEVMFIGVAALTVVFIIDDFIWPVIGSLGCFSKCRLGLLHLRSALRCLQLILAINLYGK